MSKLRVGARRTFVLSVGAVVALLGGSSMAVAAPSSHPGPGNGNTPPGTLEVDVTNSPNQMNGRPTLAVNPTNPNNLVFTAGIFGASITPSDPCFVAYSMDRGQTWTQATWPGGDRPFCGEAEVTVDAQGTFYLGSNQLGCPPGSTDEFACDLANHTAVSRSIDGGATWSAPVQTPLHIAGKAHLTVDLKTGKLYAEGATQFLAPGGISVSADQGQTWSPPVAAIPNQPPCTPPAPGFGCGITPYVAVYDGILATADEDPARGVVFNVSANDGKTFTTLPVTDSNGTPVPSAGDSLLFPPPFVAEPWIAADPTQPGRFAVMIPRGDPSTNNTFQVYLTSDAGQTWQGPTVIPAPNAFHPAIAFGDQGWLGIMWRAGTDFVGGSAQQENAFAVVSLNHGKSFSPPVQVNAVTEPIHNSGQPPGDTGPSGLALANGNVYVAWSDGRQPSVPPFTDAIFARVPIHKFQTANT
jgi:hypothetical protein